MEWEKMRAACVLIATTHGLLVDDPRKAQIKALYMVLKDKITDQGISRALEVITETWSPKFKGDFPGPAEWIKAAGLSAPDRARSALAATRWAANRLGAYDSVTFGDPALHAVVERWGGWVQVCAWSDDDWSMRSKQFLCDYEASVRSNRRGEEYLLGIHDTDNLRNGFKQWVKTAKMVCVAGLSQFSAKLVPLDYERLSRARIASTSGIAVEGPSKDVPRIGVEDMKYETQHTEEAVHESNQNIARRIN